MAPHDLTDEQIAALTASAPPLEGEARTQMRLLLAGNAARESATMTMEETAAWLGIGLRTFKAHYLSWKVPHYRLGGRVLFRQPDLDAWLKTRRQEGTRASR